MILENCVSTLSTNWVVLGEPVWIQGLLSTLCHNNFVEREKTDFSLLRLVVIYAAINQLLGLFRVML